MSRPAARGRRHSFLIALKLLVTGSLLAAVAHGLDWSALGDSLARINWWPIAGAFAIQMLVFVFGNLRWWVLLDTHGLGYRPRTLLRPFLVGAFFNNVLPSATGGDLFRMYHVYRDGHGVPVAMSPVITERLLGLACIIGLASVALPFAHSTHPAISTLKTFLPFALAAAIAGLSLVGWRTSYWTIHRLLERIGKARFVQALLRVAEASHRYLNQPGLVLRLVVLSVAMQLCEVGVYFAIGQAVGTTMSFWSFVLIVPVAMAAAAFPLAIGGLGAREATAAALFVALGMTRNDAAVISLLFPPLLLLASLPGLALFLLQRRREPMPGADEASVFEEPDAPVR